MSRALIRRSLKLVRVALLAGVAFQCGGGVPALPTAVARGELSGRVFLTGPVSGATVTAWRVDARLERLALLASASTDAAGAFAVPLPAYQGPLLLVASTGTFIDAATGAVSPLDGQELTAALAGLRAGEVVRDLRLTPVSTWTAALAAAHVKADGASLADALQVAAVHLHAHLGELDWRAVTPGDPTAGAASLSPEGRAGLLLAGLSGSALRSAQRVGATPGLATSAAAALGALTADARDGTFDGRQSGAPLLLAGEPLSPTSLRLGLAQGVAAFVSSARNASGLTAADALPLEAALARATDPFLFCLHGQAATCAPVETDVEPPVVVFHAPSDGGGVHRTLVVDVRAEDPSKLAVLKLLAPVALAGTKPLLDAAGTHGALTAQFDVSALPDGPLVVAVRAEDALGNVRDAQATVTVANHAPTVSVTSPSEGAVVKGTVTLGATAEGQGAALQSLQLVSPPAGVGPDTAASAGSFVAAWDSTQAPEGPCTLTFRATDANGAASDFAVTVQVDNVAAGVVTAQVSAGAPLAGATVQLLAIDDATGLPVVGRAGGAVLGTSAPTAADGAVTFTLTGENWDGPVQLVAGGPALTFVDPSDGTSTVSVPSTFALTSTLARYRTGDALAAPVTLWTTLADAAAHAHAAGKNPAAPGVRPLSQSLAVVDPLFSGHFSRPTAWPLRNAAPVLLTAPPAQTLRDVVFAAFGDVALNQLARQVSLENGLSPGQVVTAVTLTSSLLEDLGDGRFDGRFNGAPLKTAGAPGYLLDANTTRFRLATELDRFIRGPNNASGLSRLDLMNAGVLANVAGDVSLLYPPSSPPLPFDDIPPTVTLTVTFEAADGSTGNAPVGAGRRVAGRLTVTADATDPSGVGALEVKVGAAPLSPAQGSTPAHFVGTWLTSGDGPLTLTASAADTVGNRGDTPLTLTVDNTAPAVVVTAPSGFRSATLDVDVSATDPGGVLTLAPTHLPGFVDQDAARDRAFGSWPIPALLADGPMPVTFEACDTVKNCATATATPTLDRTPPSLTLEGPPPAAFTNATQLDLTFAATDGAGAGVGAVKLRQGATVVDGVPSNGLWTFTAVPLPASGTASLVVWAVDRADAPNSGSGQGGAHELGYSVRVDRTPPAAVPSPFPSYFDERAMDFQRTATGAPVMPVAYTFPSGQAVALAPGMTVYKAGTRLFAADGNVPVLHYAVPFDPATDAPVEAVLRWPSSPHCPGCGGEVLLQPDATRTQPGMAFFRLELSREAMGGRTGPQSLNVVFRDAAGNETERHDSITWNVVRPPVSLVEEAGWAQAADPRSVFAYRIASNSYAALFAANANFSAHPAARLVRYVVRNPAPYPVAVDLELVAGAQSIKETWTNLRTDLFARDGNGAFVADGFSIPRFQMWDSNVPAQCTDGTPVPPACSETALSNGYFPWHRRGSSVQYECGGPSLLSSADTVSAQLQSKVGLAAYRSPLPGGNEPDAADPFLDLTTGLPRGAIVPAAVGSTPGEVVFYLEVALPSARTEPLQWQASLEDPVLKYQYAKGDLLMFDSQGFSCATSVFNQRFHTWRWTRALTAATSNVNGLFVLKTGAPMVVVTSGAPWPQYGLGSVGAAQTFNRSFQH